MVNLVKQILQTKLKLAFANLQGFSILNKVWSSSFKMI